ncbi:hypothetical protein [Priestia megaterium]|uniref:hypothetical protein n=1 Tax=Priestia megaterium TaxID=1404 RepID=UPI0014944805|nr:hypothetical protein [Priestia megaterium]
MKKMQYDNTEVVIISSRPSSDRKKHTAAYMERVEQSSKKMIETLKEIEERYKKY